MVGLCGSSATSYEGPAHISALYTRESQFWHYNSTSTHPLLKRRFFVNPALEKICPADVFQKDQDPGYAQYDVRYIST
jgi:hypothetical protein